MLERLITFILGLGLAVVSSGCISLDLAGGSGPLREREIRRDVLSWSKILVVPIEGEIEGRDRAFSRGTTPSDVRAMLERAAEDRRIRAIVLRVDSPGGEVTATDLVHHDLRRFRAETGIPVFASIQSMGTSGAYYVSAAADEIYSHPTAVVGSIGVIARVPNLSGLADKVGYRQVTFKSGANKDLADPLKDMTPEQRAMLQRMVDGMHERFVGAVVAGRDAYTSADQLRPVADGRIFTPQEALDAHLIDGVAYLDDVIERAKTAAGVSRVRVVTYSRSHRPDRTLYSMLAPKLSLIDFDLEALFGGRTGFFYLWSPTD